jgi:hypothetical protein
MCRGHARLNFTARFKTIVSEPDMDCLARWDHLGLYLDEITPQACGH